MHKFVILLACNISKFVLTCNIMVLIIFNISILCINLGMKGVLVLFGITVFYGVSYVCNCKPFIVIVGVECICINVIYEFGQSFLFLVNFLASVDAHPFPSSFSLILESHVFLGVPFPLLICGFVS